MKLMDHCFGCLMGLSEKTVALSGGDEMLLFRCRKAIEELWDENSTPPEIANKVLRFIRETTGVYDPYLLIKAGEVDKTRKATKELRAAFPGTLEGHLKFAALGNSMDFFVDGGYDTAGFEFVSDVDKIQKEIYTKGKTVLILADNVGELLFDVGLIRYLEEMGKTVYYAAKEHPVQNDLSIADVERFRFQHLFPNIISTRTDEVGIRREDMKGRIRELWESDGIVIAKGMGNYETISEYGGERPVIHILKVKCPVVAHAVQKKVGQYIAMIGGEQHGS